MRLQQQDGRSSANYDRCPGGGGWGWVRVFSLKMNGYASVFTKSIEKGHFFAHTASSTSFAERVWFLVSLPL